MKLNRSAIFTLGGILLSALTACGQSPTSSFDVNKFKLSPDGTPGKNVGITQPFEEAKLAPGMPGVVMKINVKRGDRITKGQELLVIDDRVEQQAVKVVEAELLVADVMIDAARVTSANKKTELERVTRLFDQKNATPQEFETAKLNYDLSLLEIRKAETEKAAKEAQVLQTKKRLEQMRITAKFDGVVRELLAKEGEIASVDPQQPSIIAVSIEKLKVEVYLPTASTIGLERAGKTGAVELDVRFPGSDKAAKGRIIYFDPVAEVGPGQRKITLEVENPDSLPAGLAVDVILPEAYRVADVGQ